MLVSEILRIKGNALFTTPPNGTVLEAVKSMAQHDIGSLVVMDHGQMAGILTFAEVLEALAQRSPERRRERALGETYACLGRRGQALCQMVAAFPCTQPNRQSHLHGTACVRQAQAG